VPQFNQSAQTTSRKTGVSLVDVGLALAPLVLIITTEVLNSGRISPVVLPILWAGVVVGARRQWPLWSLWWLGWTLSVTILAALFWLPGPARPPVVFAFWKLILSTALLSTGLALWQRGDGFRVAFTLFPWSLEFSRFVLFDDLPTDEANRFILMHVAGFLIYAGVAAFAMRQRSRSRIRWLALSVGVLAYFVVAIVASYPIIGFFVITPAYLPLLVLLALGPLVVGLGLDGHRARHRLSAPIRLTLLAAVVLSIVGLVAPWFTGDLFLEPPYAPVGAEMPGPRRAVIVDTDLSFDDYVAILYLLQRPDIDTLGVTVVNGVAHVEAGLENIHRLLAMAGREDIPVAAGPPIPLAGDKAFPDSWRLAVDYIFRPAFPRPATSPADITASYLIHQLVTDSPSPVSLIALGPLTNVAQALQDDPALVFRFDTVLISGGTVYAEDLDNPYAVADWNLYIDPHAADLVFHSGVPLVLVPLDVTDPHGPGSILVRKAFVNRFADTTHGRESQLMTRIMKAWLLTSPDGEAVALWDEPVVAIATDPTICTDWRDLSIRIALEPAEMAGKTVVDEDGQPNTRVCLAGDQDAFEAIHLATAH
jgi:pyrimidine-specific ribonucleoside hydrolase